ncbi:hypothetical protein HK405_000342, partial [Cladochytrium tenue]
MRDKVARTALVVLAWCCFLALPVGATTVTYTMAAHERACFYGTALAENEKLAFYFAVQYGGSFDVDYEVKAPDGRVVLSGEREQQGDFVMAAPTAGDLSFCFFNVAASFAEK